MRGSDRLLEGLIALGGRPSSRRPPRLHLEREPRRILEIDIALRERWVALLEATAAACAAEGSDGNAPTLVQLLETERVRWIGVAASTLSRAASGAAT